MIDINNMSNEEILKSELENEGRELTEEDLQNVLAKINEYLEREPTLMFVEAYSNAMEDLRLEQEE
jgi:hypothetical protein